MYTAPNARCARLCRVFLVGNGRKDMAREQAQLEAAGFVGAVHFFPTGEDLVRYMKKAGFYDRSVLCLIPTLVIIALEKWDGLALRTIAKLKSDPFLKSMPILATLRHESLRSIAWAREAALVDDTLVEQRFNLPRLRHYAARGWQWPTRDMWLQ